jgi:hypothetical protein
MQASHPTQVEPDVVRRRAARRGIGRGGDGYGRKLGPGRFEKSSFCLAISTGIHRREILFADKFRITRIVYTA